MKILPLFLNTSQQCLLMLPLHLRTTKQLFWLILTRTFQDLPRFAHCLMHQSTAMCRRRLYYRLRCSESSSEKVVKKTMVLALMTVNVTSLFASTVPFCQRLLSRDLKIGSQSGYRKTFWRIYWLMAVLWFLLGQGILRNGVYRGGYLFLSPKKALF